MQPTRDEPGRTTWLRWTLKRWRRSWRPSRDFVDSDVRPAARELDHGNIYPEALIETMKKMGIFGLAIPEPVRRPASVDALLREVTEELSRGWMQPDWRDGGPHRRVQAHPRVRYREQKKTYLPRMATGDLRATMALTEPGGGSPSRTWRRRSPLFCSEAAMQRALDAIRVHGGFGYSAEFDVERYFRDAPLMIVGEGTDEIQRNVIVRQLVDRGGL